MAKWRTTRESTVAEIMFIRNPEKSIFVRETPFKLPKAKALTGVAIGDINAQVVDRETRSNKARGFRLRLRESTMIIGKNVRATVVLLINSVRKVTIRATVIYTPSGRTNRERSSLENAIPMWSGTLKSMRTPLRAAAANAMRRPFPGIPEKISFS